MTQTVFPFVGTAGETVTISSNRAEFAARAMQGMLSNATWADGADMSVDCVAQDAVAYADALIEELAKGEK